MRIAQVAPLYETVPPKTYGGTERVVSYLTEELVRQGHDVTLFASGDSRTAAHLIAPCRQSLRLDSRCVDPMAHHILLINEVFKNAGDFDFIHFHIDYLHFPMSRRERLPHVTTLHGRLDLPDLVYLYREFNEMPLVSISNAQRRPLAWANWRGTVYHGVPEEIYRLHEAPGKYLAFLGRISPEKGIDQAIQIARRSGIPLKIAAKVDRVDREYFEAVIKPLMDTSLVEYIGEVGEMEKDEFLGNALALLSPVNWPEPFGLVLIEAMACGTPVVAYDRGSIPEIVQDGVTGYVVRDLESALQALSQVTKLDRKASRQLFERKFTTARMCKNYVSIYGQLLESAQEMAMAL